jgi:hypothetical protein
MRIFFTRSGYSTHHDAQNLVVSRIFPCAQKLEKTENTHTHTHTPNKRVGSLFPQKKEKKIVDTLPQQ